ncbi:MAG: 2-carboxy-1,4-naphthoquinone phytyltransferase [Cyanobacteria bacterium J06641_5]
MAVTSLQQENQENLWLAALKPPIYSVAIVPIAVGSAAAYWQTKTLSWPTFVTFLLAAILTIAWLNISNDVFDSETGIDKHKAHSIVNITGNKSLMFWIANACLAIALAAIAAISWWQQDITVIGLILLACALGYSYQGPPFRLGYQGWGEIICFFSFGPIAIEAAYYSQAQNFSELALIPATVVGLTTSIVLFCSHFHQVEDDLAAGKRSPIVRMGTAQGAVVLSGTTLMVFVLLGVAIGLGALPLWAAVVFLSAPFGWELVQFVRQFHDIPSQVRRSKFVAVKLHFISGLLLALGLALPVYLG